MAEVQGALGKLTLAEANMIVGQIDQQRELSGDDNWAWYLGTRMPKLLQDSGNKSNTLDAVTGYKTLRLLLPHLEEVSQKPELLQSFIEGYLQSLKEKLELEDLVLR